MRTLSHYTDTWESLSEVQREFLRSTSTVMGLDSPDIGPGPILAHVQVCPTCWEKMRVMAATGQPATPPRVGFWG